MKSVNFLFAVHNHQPVGNFDFVIHEAYERAYKPFLDVLEKHPHVKISLHYSGILFDWFEEHQPNFLSRLQALLKSGQVELLTGAYYEAILPVLPEEDRHGQIRKLTEYILKRFGVAPTGMWLAERVWEQSLASSLVESGVKFTLLDDTHFHLTGTLQDDLIGYYTTEDQGKTVALFPMSKTLRYTVPFQPVNETIEYLRKHATDDGTQLVTFGDDGEKFGIWPTTYKHVYEDGWLDEFFTALGRNSDWLKVRHFTEFMEALPPAGRIYLPDASYSEMMHWVLSPHLYAEFEEFMNELKLNSSAEKHQHFVRGGFWRNFFVKYPEANNLHKKMLRTSDRVHRLEKQGRRIPKALDYLWAGQCNDAYWHGVFGGLYLPHLRAAAFRNLLRAESILNRSEKLGTARIDEVDFDCDGRQELLVEAPSLNLYFKPDQGGSIFELDFLPVEWNLCNVMTRQEEGYHKKLQQLEAKSSRPSSAEGAASIHDLVLTREEDIAQYLAYDWYRRATLLDHFLGENVLLQDFSKCKYEELGDFVNRPYEHQVSHKDGVLHVDLSRDGHLRYQKRRLPLTVSKSVGVKKDPLGLGIHYRLVNPSEERMDLRFGVEFCLALSAGDAPDRYYRFDGKKVEDGRLNSSGEIGNVGSMELVDEWLGVAIGLKFLQPANVWRFPIESVSLSEAGFERNYQGSVLFPNWKIRLQKVWEVELSLELRLISKTSAQKREWEAPC